MSLKLTLCAHAIVHVISRLLTCLLRETTSMLHANGGFHSKLVRSEQSLYNSSRDYEVSS